MPNVYIGGERISNLTHRKLDSIGVVWSRDHGSGVWGTAVDPDGNVYISGNRVNSLTHRKYNSSGALQWSKDHGANLRDISVDNSGNVYVSGIVTSTISHRKLDSNGNIIWSKSHGSHIMGISADVDGNVYIGGYSGTDSMTHRKLDSLGNPIWSKIHASIVFGGANDLDGNMYICGGSSTADGTTHLKIDSDGNTVWSKDHGETVTGISVDVNGNVYIGGTRSSNLTHRKLDSNGNIVWSKDHVNTVYGIKPDVDGNVYIGGNRSSNLTHRKYASNGDLIWSRDHGNHIYEVSVDPGLYGAGFWPASAELNTYTADTKREIGKLYSYTSDSERKVNKQYDRLVDSVRDVIKLNTYQADTTRVSSKQNLYQADTDRVVQELNQYASDTMRDLLKGYSYQADTIRQPEGLISASFDANRVIVENNVSSHDTYRGVVGEYIYDADAKRLILKDEYYSAYIEREITKEYHYTADAIRDFAGNGTEENPFLVITYDDLLHIGSDGDENEAYYREGWTLDAHYKQFGDIQCPTGESQHNFHPIGWKGGEGVSYHNFTGSYDGNDHEIRDLYINRETVQLIGLIARNTGTIKNVKLVDVDVTGDRLVGALLGSNVETGEIINCSSSGSVLAVREGTPNALAGGLVGYSAGEKIRGCYSSCDVTSSGRAVGGLLGGLYRVSEGGAAIVEDCYAEGDVAGETSVGGLIGLIVGGSNPCSVYRSVSFGKVTGVGGGRAAGFIGNAGKAVVEDCACFSPQVTGKTAVGFIGELKDNVIRRCYAASGDMLTAGSPNHYLAGFYYLDDSSFISPTFTIEDCYWDSTVSNRSNGGVIYNGSFPITSNLYVTARTTIQMMDIDTFLPEWDIVPIQDYYKDISENIWHIDHEYNYPGLPLMYTEPVTTLVSVTQLSNQIHKLTWEVDWDA